ncbi:hypothetical protein DL96DRAFT_1771523 [Flagelloscypha sp. PMI_526]|nr:hypothetical protein DL96DRAFT_1771523 [Flagelloscypha sp. PMI_526]
MSTPTVGTVQTQLEPLPLPTPGPSPKRRFKLPTLNNLKASPIPGFISISFLITSLSCFIFFSSNGLGKAFIESSYSHNKGEYFASILAGGFCSISYHLLLAIPFRREWRRSTSPRNDMHWSDIRWGMKKTDVLLLVLNLPLGGAAYNVCSALILKHRFPNVVLKNLVVHFFTGLSVVAYVVFALSLMGPPLVEFLGDFYNRLKK